MKREVYTADKAEEFIKKQIPLAKSILTKKITEAKTFPTPCYLKLISTKASHKSDIGGVIKANNEEEIINAFDTINNISKKKKLPLKGIQLQEEVQGQQLIIGLKKDPTFGHAIMLGLGGIFVEVFKDVSFRLCPIAEKDVDEMINELKTKDTLFGARGQEKINLQQLKEIMVKVSKLPQKHPEISELDLNPIIINKKEAKVVDVRLITEK